VLTELAGQRAFGPVQAIEPPPASSPPPVDADEPLNHERFWASVQRWLPPATTVIAEAGTAFYGALDLRLPRDSDLLGSPVWSSIGYTLPATLGASLARPERRPVLFIGDGSAQLTIQELGTIYALGLRPIVFLLNNGGYTVERAIQSPHAVYQDIVSWSWTRIPEALGASGVATVTVRTESELASALRLAADPAHPTFVEVVLPNMDTPRLLGRLAEGLAKFNARSEAPTEQGRLAG
jgi:TPP-dependent 2-oxoacid decarboxylase